MKPRREKIITYDPVANGALCNECPLNGRPFVPPTGSLDAEVALVGEGPGFHEEIKREPFVGRSGVELNDILKSIGYSRARVYITNAVLCRAETPGLEGKRRYDFKTFLAWVKRQNALRKKLAREHKATFVPIKTPLECCAPRLWNELRMLEWNARKRGLPNGAVVIPLGNFALQAVTGRQGVMKHRGSCLTVTGVLPEVEGGG